MDEERNSFSSAPEYNDQDEPWLLSRRQLQTVAEVMVGALAVLLPEMQRMVFGVLFRVFSCHNRSEASREYFGSVLRHSL